MASATAGTTGAAYFDPVGTSLYNPQAVGNVYSNLAGEISGAANDFKQSSLGQAIYGVSPYQPPAFNESNFNVPSYSNVWQAGTNQDEENLAAQNAQTLASQQAGGTLNSGSTGMGLSGNLQGFQNNQSNLANNIANMQYNDALQQYETQVAAGEQNYQTQQSNANNLRSTLGSALGAALVAAALMW